MSFFRTIKFIMDESGLKDVLSEAYAPLSVDEMVEGHAYTRTVRNHLLLHFALGKNILSTIAFTDEERHVLQGILDNIQSKYF